MSTVNPYAPPGAAVADVDDLDPGTQPVKLFSAQGRIGRLRFLAYTTVAYLLFFAASMLVGVVVGFAGGKDIVSLVVSLMMLPWAIFAILISIQRSHDMNWSGWWILLGIVPLVGLIWLVKGGTKGANRYGAPPPPNTLGIKILGLAFPVIVGIGIVAAIALPAYQDYVKRAKAAQVGK
jgi:uncharacterized membrane protein YhaH (DUF805 family)